MSAGGIRIPSLAVRDDVGDAARIGRDDRAPACEGLEHDATESFGPRRQHERARSVERLGDLRRRQARGGASPIEADREGARRQRPAASPCRRSSAERPAACRRRAARPRRARARSCTPRARPRRRHAALPARERAAGRRTRRGRCRSGSRRSAGSPRARSTSDEVNAESARVASACAIECRAERVGRPARAPPRRRSVEARERLGIAVYLDDHLRRATARGGVPRARRPPTYGSAATTAAGRNVAQLARDLERQPRVERAARVRQQPEREVAGPRARRSARGSRSTLVERIPLLRQPGRERDGQPAAADEEHAGSQRAASARICSSRV